MVIPKSIQIDEFSQKLNFLEDTVSRLQIENKSIINSSTKEVRIKCF